MSAADHHRVSPEGQMLGKTMARFADMGFKQLAAIGVSDTRCASCAFRLGTVPNGCIQTQLDTLKAVTEGGQFLCHAPQDGRLCAGYVACRAYKAMNPLPPEIRAYTEKYPYSPPDEVTS